MRSLYAWLVPVWLAACVPIGAPFQEVSELARDVNLATRFGRMDIAFEHTSDAHRKEFLRKRADWGTEIRILDVEMSGVELKTPESAEATVDVSWVRMNEGLLRSTRVKQAWQNEGGGWLLNSEERQSGDVGLLGERVVVMHPDAPKDVHFPVKTLGYGN